MDDGKTDGLRAPDRVDKPLGRGLEDVSHLFLSPKAPEAASSDQAATRSTARPSPPPGSRGGIALLRPASVTREQLEANAVEWGFDTHLGVFHFGTLPRDLTERSLRLFASEVAPHLRHVNEAAPSSADQAPTHAAV